MQNKSSERTYNFLDDVDKERIKKNILIKFNNDFGETKKKF